ncbi:hypothetical protein PAXRUDRAFT_27206 [Paxillus rubicundulus Ve08.2h10]|uniref:Uncharacterized protein n=1 Tax=Paxillus rubicundulus Ve08.2h10 TaxID=930991 RepID=A0A0D0DIY0_9AGAM|nr:hypothetical protein PAXRUDRAFT_27206 [Paxillus rubicundulus Ve08.2h10]
MFLFNFICGVGQTDGDAPEQGWVNINPAASSTKEMGPCASTNYVGEYQEAHADLEKGLVEDHSEDLAQWKVQVEAWEKDSSNTNPYEHKVETITLAAVHLKLAKQEAKDIQAGMTNILHEDCSPNVLISTVLELEDQRYTAPSGCSA